MQRARKAENFSSPQRKKTSFCVKKTSGSANSAKCGINWMQYITILRKNWISRRLASGKISLMHKHFWERGDIFFKSMISKDLYVFIEEVALGEL